MRAGTAVLRRSPLLVLVAVLAWSSVLGAQQPALNFAKLEARRDSFVVMVQGNALGSSVYALESTTNGWMLRESTNVMNGMMLQSTALQTDAKFNPKSMLQSGTMQGQALKSEIAFSGAHATGNAMSMTTTGPQSVVVDATLPLGTINADAMVFVLPLLAWAEKSVFTLNTFNAGKGTIDANVFTVVGSETVTVPAGTFETWKVEQKMPMATVTLFISKDAAHRLVKIAPSGQPVELVLAK